MRALEPMSLSGSSGPTFCLLLPGGPTYSHTGCSTDLESVFRIESQYKQLPGVIAGIQWMIAIMTVVISTRKEKNTMKLAENDRGGNLAL
jgi:hypothetical protein